MLSNASRVMKSLNDCSMIDKSRVSYNLYLFLITILQKKALIVNPSYGFTIMDVLRNTNQLDFAISFGILLFFWILCV
jgi:hypothetical protein